MCSFIRTQTEGKCCISTVFWPFLAGSKWRISSRPQATTVPSVLRMCSSKVLIVGALPKAPVQKTPSASRSILASCQPRRARVGFGRHQNVPLFSATPVANTICSLLCQQQLKLPQNSQPRQLTELLWTPSAYSVCAYVDQAIPRWRQQQQ